MACIRRWAAHWRKRVGSGRSSETSSQRSEQGFAFLRGVVHVGVENERGQVVFLAAPAEALEVDEVGLAVFDHDVLRLEIAMDQVAGGGSEAFGELGEYRVCPQGGGVLSEVFLDEEFEEILLFPAVEFLIEGREEFQILGRAGIEQAVDLVHGRAVDWQAVLEGLVLH